MNFIISAQTLLELENIKSDRRKDETIKLKARTVSLLLDKWADAGIYSVYYDQEFYQDEDFQQRYIMPDHPDSVICYSAWRCYQKDRNIVFCTDDICCKNIASSLLRLPVCGSSDVVKPDTYTGYKEVTLSDQELADLYSVPGVNTYCLIPGQYLIARNASEGVTELFRWSGDN